MRYAILRASTGSECWLATYECWLVAYGFGVSHFSSVRDERILFDHRNVALSLAAEVGGDVVRVEEDSK